MIRIPTLSLLVLAALASCRDSGPRPPKLYVALDQEHSERILDRYQEETGREVSVRFDSEATKTVGLVSAISQEEQRPLADVFWNNELAQTVRLANKGLLAPYDSPSAAGIPARYRSEQHLWTGFAARARVLIVNTEILPDPKDWPTSMWDLIDPKWKGRCAVAQPLTGTTLTHFAALREVLGEAEFDRFVDGLYANDVKMLTSNGATMRQTAETQKGIAFAFTDTDDFHVALNKGLPVACVFPDQGEGQIGTMLIPNSIALVKGGPNPEGGKQLIDFVLSTEIEAMLAASKSAQIPVRTEVEGPAEEQILKIGGFVEMSWDPEAVADNLDQRMREFNQRFGR